MRIGVQLGTGIRGGQKGWGPEALNACDWAGLTTTTNGPTSARG